MSDTLLDSYSEANQDDSFILASDTNRGAGQSFTTPNDGKTYKLTSAKVYFLKHGSPSGNAYIKIYAHSGTFGTNSVPTGSPLATSDARNLNTVGTDDEYSLEEWVFSGANQISLSPNTHYCVVFTYAYGGGVTFTRIGKKLTAGTAAGNGFYSTDLSAWSSASSDVCFYVYGLGTVIFSGNDTMSISDNASAFKLITFLVSSVISLSDSIHILRTLITLSQDTITLTESIASSIKHFAGVSVKRLKSGFKKVLTFVQK